MQIRAKTPPNRRDPRRTGGRPEGPSNENEVRSGISQAPDRGPARAARGEARSAPTQAYDRNLAVRLRAVLHVLRRLSGDPGPCIVEAPSLESFGSDRKATAILELDRRRRLLG